MTHEIYQSPFSWRYGSDEMRQLWSERNKRVIYRKLWVSLAKVQSSFGLVTPDQVKDLNAQIENIDIATIFKYFFIFIFDLNVLCKIIAALLI